MHIWSSIHPIFTWSIIKIILFSSNLCRSQSNTQCSTNNCQRGQEEIIPFSPPVDYSSSSSLALFPPFGSDSTRFDPSASSPPDSSSSSSPSYFVYPVAPSVAPPSFASSSSLSSPSSQSSSPSLFPSAPDDFISISPRSSSIASSLAASRRRKNKYRSKSIKKSRYLDRGQAMKCSRRKYTYMASNTDSNGRRCWQPVTVSACWGRCETGEYPDWEFPFKRSVHPVCTYERQQTLQIKLRHCDEGVDESLSLYQYTEALSCSCKLCQSLNTSCRISSSLNKII